MERWKFKVAFAYQLKDTRSHGVDVSIEDHWSSAMRWLAWGAQSLVGSISKLSSPRWTMHRFVYTIPLGLKLYGRQTISTLSVPSQKFVITMINLIDFYRISPVFVTVLNRIFQILLPPYFVPTGFRNRVQPSLNSYYLSITRFFKLHILKNRWFSLNTRPRLSYLLAFPSQIFLAFSTFHTTFHVLTPQNGYFSRACGCGYVADPVSFIWNWNEVRGVSIEQVEYFKLKSVIFIRSTGWCPLNEIVYPRNERLKYNTSLWPWSFISINCNSSRIP